MLSELRYVIRSYRRLRKAPADGLEATAWKALCEKVSFRLDNPPVFNALHGFKMIYRTLRMMRSKLPYFTLLEGDTTIAMFGCNENQPLLEEEYIRRQAEKKPGIYIIKTRLASAFGTHKKAMIWFCWYAFPIALRCAFISKNRGNHALHITLIAEQAALLHLLKSQNIRELFDFSPFLIDSNWSFLLNRNEKVTHTKIPSPGPLYTHNSTVFADRLILSSGYHLEELAHLKGLKCAAFDYWVPEAAFTYLDRYHPNFPQPKKKTIGYYSHGTWLRRKLGQSEDGLKIDDAESQLLSDLSVFLRDNEGYELIIFLHPKERKPAYKDDTHTFYQGSFAGMNYSYSEEGQRSTQSFDKVDMGLIALSTILFERLFCGYKTLIGSYAITNFPMEDSALNQIAFKNADRLSALIQSTDDMSGDAFFAQPGLEKYRYDYYPYFGNTRPEELRFANPKVVIAP